MMTLPLALLIKINIWVFVVQSPGQISISGNALDYSLAQILRKYSEIGIQANIKRVAIIADEYPQYATLEKQGLRHLVWNRWAYRRGYKRPRRLVHFIFPPMCDEKTKRCGWFAGLGSGCVYRSRLGISISNAAEITDYGNRLNHGILSVNHEAGHSLGMKHIPGENVMDTLMLGYVAKWGLALPWHKKSINDVRQCLNRPYALTPHERHIKPGFL